MLLRVETDYAGILREHIAPPWGKVRLANGSHAGPGLGHHAVADPLSRDGAQGAPSALAHPRPRRQGRPVGAQRRGEDQLAPSGAERATPPDPHAGRGAGRRVRVSLDYSKHRPLGERQSETYRLAVLSFGLHRRPLRRDGRASGRAAGPGTPTRGDRRVGDRRGGPRSRVGHPPSPVSAAEFPSRGSWRSSSRRTISDEDVGDLAITVVRAGGPRRSLSPGPLRRRCSGDRPAGAAPPRAAAYRRQSAIPRSTSEHTAATAGRMRRFRCPALPQCSHLNRRGAGRR